MAGGQADTVDPRRIFVLSGPSGVGKNTLARRLCERGLAVRAVTATTRPPKPGEVDGRDYHFVDRETFERWIREGQMVEHARYVDNWYGTPLFALRQAAASGLPVLLTIEVNGGLQVKRRWPEATLIFVRPPSEAVLRERLRGRGRDDEEAIEKRLRRARQEFAMASQYDFQVVNDDLDKAVEQVADILRERSRTRSRTDGGCLHEEN